MASLWEMAKKEEKPRWSDVYELNRDNINEHVPEKIGNYRLGIFIEDVFYVAYVGRDDSSVQRRLLEHVTAINNGEEPVGYVHFCFMTQTCARDAYLQECKDYHSFKRLKNKKHPDRPDGTDWKCPESSCKFSKEEWNGKK